MKGKVVLCSPASEDFIEAAKDSTKHFGRYLPPLGLLLVAQALSNAGHDIKFYDGNFNFNYKKDLGNFISANKDEIVFVGIYLAMLQIKECIEIIRLIKAIGGNIPIVIGGPFPSSFPDILMNSGMVDICCVGDGAGVAPDIARSLAGGALKLRDIPNIIFREADKTVATQKTHRDVLTDKSRIFYEKFLDLELYVNKFDTYLNRDYDPYIKRAIPILTGMGCSYKCAFCENALLGHSHISLPAEEIVEQILYYKEKFNIDSFAFFDEDFFTDKNRLFKFLEIINNKDLKIKWGTQSRVNYFNENYINGKVLKDLKKSGCIRISFGVESGSPRMLKKIRKGITPEQVISAAELGKGSDIYFSYSFIVNLPGESREDYLMTYNLIYKLLSIKKNSFISAIHHYFAYPGTPLSIEAERKMGYKIEDRLNFEQFAGLSLEKYSSYVNPQKEDAYCRCIKYCYHHLNMPFQFKLSPRAIHDDLFRAIGTVRKRFNFYHLPVEIYINDLFKYIATAVCGFKRLKYRKDHCRG